MFSSSSAATNNISNGGNNNSNSNAEEMSLLASPPGSMDFDHHKAGVARLNHASFGAAPKPVLQVQEEFRQSWLAQPDEWYFSGQLHESVRKATAAAGQVLVPANKTLPKDQICLVENSTVAACAVAYRWRSKMRPGDVVVHFNFAYQSCIYILKEYCHPCGATLAPLNLPFFRDEKITQHDILDSLRQQLQQLADNGLRPKFAFLDHITSQPSMLLPIKEIIALVREYGDDRQGVEVCVDGAHAVGSVSDLDVLDLDCDFYFSNFHKWGFGPPTATVMWSKYLPEMKHPIVSWAWGSGMAEESLFPGSRDFSAIMSVPAAVEYLQTWRSSEGLNSAEYCHQNVLQAAAKLRNDWGTAGDEVDIKLVATQAMVPLPKELLVTDLPGQKSQQRGLRDILRQDCRMEASVSAFGDQGAYLRLSYAVYNAHEETQRLSDAVTDVLQKQQ